MPINLASEWVPGCEGNCWLDAFASQYILCQWDSVICLPRMPSLFIPAGIWEGLMQKIRTTSLNQIHSFYFDVVRSLVGVLYICSFNEGGILQCQNPLHCNILKLFITAIAYVLSEGGLNMICAISKSVLFDHFKVCIHAINSWHAAKFLK